MLESRSFYMNENVLSPTKKIVRVNYKDYKQKYSNYKAVNGSYDEKNKTIELYFDKEHAEMLPNLGNTHIRHGFTFVFNNSNNSKIICNNEYINSDIFAGTFEAKNIDNATKNAKKWAKLNNCIFLNVVENNRSIQSYGTTVVLNTKDLSNTTCWNT
jgi:hypothetical protein